MPQPLTISLVIPVYNEEDHIADCLDAIARQTVKPLEVIVVDNNSTDNTVAIASRYPFVTILKEPRQGVVHARTRGFNAARGDIIGRLDADTLLDQDWVSQVQLVFADTTIMAVSGTMKYQAISWSKLINRIDLFWRRYMAKHLGREVALQGANMALRRSAWQKIRGNLCYRAGLHEDFDVAIHLQYHGLHVMFDERPCASISHRRFHSSFLDFFNYMMLSPQSYAQHHLASRKWMYPLIVFMCICYLPLQILSRGYDTRRSRFSIAALLVQTTSPRVNPAHFVD